MILLKSDKHTVTIEDEEDIHRESRFLDMPAVYSEKYNLGMIDYRLAAINYTILGIYYGDLSASDNYPENCLLETEGFSSKVKPESALLNDDHCVILFWSYIVSLQLPGLICEWYTKLGHDTAYFAVYHIPSYASYIVHGEMDIIRVSYAGEIIWSSGGKDIFTNGFALFDDYIEAIDWNNEKYRIDLETGYSEIIES